MKTLIKLSAIGIFALSLSGCALTKDVVQVAYDNKADKDCQATVGQEESIHRSAKLSCIGSDYVPRGEVKGSGGKYHLDLKDTYNERP